MVNITGFSLCYNRVTRDPERPWRTLNNLAKICDQVVIFDDKSTDGTIEELEKTVKKLDIPVSVYKSEKHYSYPTKPQKKILLEYALKKYPQTDYFCWLDMDEVFTRSGTEGGVRKVAEDGLERGIDAFWFKESNLWMSNCWKRIDMLFDKGWFPRLWRNNGQLSFTTEGHFHPIQWPVGIKKEERVPDIEVIHYALDSKEKLITRYKNRKALGMPLWYLEQMVRDEPKLIEVPNDVFPIEEMPKQRDPKHERINIDLSKLEAELR